MQTITLNMIRGIGIDEDEREIENTVPVTIIPSYIRSFNARRNDRIGTRITFANGSGFAVTELPEEVAALI